MLDGLKSSALIVVCGNSSELRDVRRPVYRCAEDPMTDLKPLHT